MQKDYRIEGYDVNFMRNISKNIRKYREAAKLSRKDLANMVGVSEDYIKKVEIYLGAKGLSLKTLYKLSLVLDIHIDNFFND